MLPGGGGASGDRGGTARALAASLADASTPAARWSSCSGSTWAAPLAGLVLAELGARRRAGRRIRGRPDPFPLRDDLCAVGQRDRVSTSASPTDRDRFAALLDGADLLVDGTTPRVLANAGLGDPADSPIVARRRVRRRAIGRDTGSRRRRAADGRRATTRRGSGARRSPIRSPVCSAALLAVDVLAPVRDRRACARLARRRRRAPARAGARRWLMPVCASRARGAITEIVFDHPPINIYDVATRDALCEVLAGGDRRSRCARRPVHAPPAITSRPAPTSRSSAPRPRCSRCATRGGVETCGACCGRSRYRWSRRCTATRSGSASSSPCSATTASRPTTAWSRCPRRGWA